MGDVDDTMPASKKRAAGRELNKDNAHLEDETDSSEQETGTFKRASDEVLASRRIVKVRRNQNTGAPSSNPFAGVRLVPPVESTAAPAEVKPEAQVEDKGKISDTQDEKQNVSAEANENKDTSKESEKENEEGVKPSESEASKVEADSAEDKDAKNEEKSTEKDDNSSADKPNQAQAVKDPPPGDVKNEEKVEKDEECENTDASTEGAQLSSFQQLSSTQNAFTGLAGTGFSTSTFSFGSTPSTGSALGSGTGSLFGAKTDQPAFSFGLSSNGNSSLFGKPGAPIVPKGEGSCFPSMQEAPVETGEENEKVVFTADSVLYEYVDGSWKERGKGELKVNVSTSGSEKARLIMRTRGNYRLILNASLYADMKLTNMDKKGITFACVNSLGDENAGLSTFALKFKDSSIMEEFHEVVIAHKDKSNTAAVLKTPENSPKATDD